MHDMGADHRLHHCFEAGLVNIGQDLMQLCRQTTALRRHQALHRQGLQAFGKDASQQFERSRIPSFATDHLNRRAHTGKQRCNVGGPLTRTEQGCFLALQIHCTRDANVHKMQTCRQRQHLGSLHVLGVCGGHVHKQCLFAHEGQCLLKHVQGHGAKHGADDDIGLHQPRPW